VDLPGQDLKRRDLRGGEDGPIRVGVSSCLLGSEVRFDGGHKRERYLTDVLADHFEWFPVCPEVELGLGTPREPVQLERANGGIRMRGVESQRDHTRAMRRLAAARLREIERADLCGYILKSRSPSCGLERVRVYGPGGTATKTGRGLFAEAVKNRLPNLPVEEEERLRDPEVRDNWIERVFAYRRLRTLFADRPSRRRLAAFHAAHELQLRAHSPGHHRSLDRLIASGKKTPPGELRERYCREFMEALARRATRRRHQSVLRRALGHLRGSLDASTSRQLRERVEAYGAGRVPLIVPITLLRHHVERLAIERLAGQVYLDPDPRESMLRNRV